MTKEQVLIYRKFNQRLIDRYQDKYKEMEKEIYGTFELQKEHTAGATLDQLEFKANEQYRKGRAGIDDMVLEKEKK